MLPDILDNSHNQMPYAFAKIDEAVRVIKQSINELPLLRKKLDKYKDDKPKAREVYGDLQQQHSRLLNSLDFATLALMEMDEQDTADYTTKLSQSIRSFNLMTPDYSKLCAVLSDYIAKLPIPDTSEAKTTNAAIIGRLMNNVKMGYYPTELEHVKHIVRGIEFSEGVTTNLLDPCCGCGLALRTLAQGNNTYTYGIELDNYRAEEAQSRLHRVGYGSYFHSRISNESFHLMLLNPPYLSVMTENGNNTRLEKRFLVDSISHLTIGGLIVFIIPYYRLSSDIARVLYDNFDDLTVWKFMGDEFKRFKQVAIMGLRCKRRDGSGLVQELASIALTPDNIPELSELQEHRYQLPATTLKVSLFKGSQFNVTELAQQLTKSNSFVRLFEKNRLDGAEHRPLSPLSVGQIGLLNGYIDCEHPHILKGRIVKANNTSREENHNNKGELMSTTLVETRSNKMVFNILTPQGFLCLSDYSGIGVAEATDDDGYSEDDKYAASGQSATVANARIPLGKVVITTNAHNVLTDTDINDAITRHQTGDYGEIGKADWESNNNAIRDGDRILSAYTSADGEKFWVLTEWDRSSTTVMLPSDY